ncbi:MAG TPA: transcriptional repressor LexA [Longimicrobiales bacterium]
MPEPLTYLERRILDYLVDYLRRNTYQPSIREIGRRFDIKSTKTVSEYLQALADKGWIERDPSRSRGVRLLSVDLSPETVTVPCFARVSATGEPLPREAVVETFELDRKLAGASGAFLLTVTGERLEFDGCRGGDMLLAELVVEEELEDGDVVVVRIGGEASVTRYRRRGDEVLLEPVNTDAAPIPVGAGSGYTVIGRVLGVLRRLRAPVAASAGSPASRDAEPQTP